MIEIPTLEEIREARERITPAAVHTPLVRLHSFEERSDIHLKLEIHQPITSFKIRGIFNAVASLSDDERSRGLSTTSAGNTAQALAWCGRYFGVPARSLMPEGAPQSKIDAVRAYGGEPVFVTVDELFRYMRERGWEQEPYTFIHPWINRDVLVGHGSAGLEILDDLAEVESVFIPVGGGGFIGGVASALKAARPDVRIVAVEPEGCPALFESLRTGEPASVDCSTICDGVAVPYITDEMFPLLRELVDEVVLVTDDIVKSTITFLAQRNKIVVEPAAALSVAAAMASSPDDRGVAVAIITGGSIDLDKLIDILGM